MFHGVTGNVEIVTILVEAGADVNARDADGDPLLLLTILEEYSNRFHGRMPNPDIIRALVESGADVNSPTVAGNPLLYEVFKREDTTASMVTPPILTPYAFLSNQGQT